MKQIYFLILLFGALLFCACEKENIDPLVEDQVQSQIEESALKGAKKHMVPIKGNFVQDQTVDGTEYVELEGVGTVSHLGKTKLWVGQYWNFISISVLPDGKAVLELEGDAEVIFTAANGDELWADLHAFNTIEGMMGNDGFIPIFATVTGSGEFTGGTGRFSEAEGTYELSAYYDFIAEKSEAFYTGEIMY